MSRALTAAYEVLQDVLGKYSCDRDRVYAMGLSMGGFGTWDLLMRYPDTFAAGVPICGGGDPSKAEILKNIPIWTRHGTADPTVPYAGTKGMYDAICAAGGEKIVFESVEGGVHNVWTDLTKNPELYKWLFAQKLSDRFPKEEETTEPVEDITPETTPVDTKEEGGCKGSAISLAVPAVIALAATVVLKKKEN
jgi:dienelactone hydrolase